MAAGVSGEIGPAALSTVWERERRRGQAQGPVLILLHRVEEETVAVKNLTQRLALTHLFAFV